MGKRYIVFLLFLMSGCSSWKKENSDNTLLHFPTDFSLVDTSAGKGGYGNHFVKGTRHVFADRVLTEVEADKASRHFQGRRNYLKGLFQPNVDPYQHRVNSASYCLPGVDIEGAPVNAAGVEYLELSVPATKEFQIGECLESDQFYVAKVFFVYCKKNKSFYEIKYFSPNLSPELLKIDFESVCSGK